MTSRAIAPTAPTKPAAAEPVASAELIELSRLVAGLRPDWRDAWAFYGLRSELVVRLRQAARRVEALERAQREAGAR
jgi:hypothetical protein